jgi:hypothetical protein
MQWATAGTNKPRDLHLTAQVDGLNPDSVGTVTVTGKSAGGSTVLAQGQSDAQPDGTLTFTTDVTAATTFSSIVLSVKVKVPSGQKKVAPKTMTLTLPASDAE